MQLAGTGRVTTAFAPMMASSPIEPPRVTVTLLPIQARSPMRTSA